MKNSRSRSFGVKPVSSHHTGFKQPKKNDELLPYVVSSKRVFDARFRKLKLSKKGISTHLSPLIHFSSSGNFSPSVFNFKKDKWKLIENSNLRF
jgi:hypothetical protein